MQPPPLPRRPKKLLQHTAPHVQSVGTALDDRLTIKPFEPERDPAELAINDIGQIKLLASKPIVFDAYANNRLTGSFILIEESTNATVAAGLLLPPIELVKPEYTDFAI